MTDPAILIIGVGNAYRGDDAAGLIALARLAEQLKLSQFDGIKISQQSGEGAALIDCWRDAQTVFLIDAVSSGAPAGTIFRIDAGNESVPVKFFRYSTHAFSVAEAVALARALDQLPKHFIIYGIEGTNYQAGSALSQEVESAIDEMVAQLLREITLIKTNE